MSRPAFSLCLCPDSRLLQTRLGALLAAHPPEGGAWQRFVFWADEGLGPAFWEHLTLQGLFATPKALIIRNAEALPADVLNGQLSPALMPLCPAGDGRLPSPLIWPLLCLEVAFDKGKAKTPAHIQRVPCFAEAAKRGWLDSTPPLAGKSLIAFIAAEAEKQGLRLKDHELAMLTAALPPEASSIVSEIAKLALAADPDGKLPDRAESLLDASGEMTIFELMRIVQQSSHASKAWRQILEDRLAGDNKVFAFIAILLREARLLWQSLAGSPSYLSSQTAMQKKIAAQGLGYAGIARLWDMALKADKGIKSGERSPEQAFEILAADLFILFGARRSR
ncbi:MAG: DNA polymerase III subunit delta [Desulfovibrio sp.]|jgi:DNA polymerase-3 subunit delta|nr:DNA polymerase III subunit delta [Desulfovibrio sp.]